MTEALQAHDLNIVDALTIIGSTIQSLKFVQRKQAEMDALIEARISYTKKKEVPLTSNMEESIASDVNRQE